MRERATAQPMPRVQIVDLAKEFESGNKRIFSTALAEALRDRLERGEKTVLFVNRRGSGGFILCRSCGHVPQCQRCDVALTAHRSEGLLRCHYCDFQMPLPRVCPACGLETIREFGVGTERVVEEVTRLFPQARVVRMDSDTTTRVGDHARLLTEFGERGDVLVGTQMVAKGLDFPTVTLVGVVAADVGLHIPDYRAAERTFDLIAQVCGRSGRASAGEAIVQTYSPKHPAIVFAAAHDFEGFARGELEERRSLQYPPVFALGVPRCHWPQSQGGAGCRGALRRALAHGERGRSTWPRALSDRAGQQRMALSRLRSSPALLSPCGRRLGQKSYPRHKRSVKRV